MFKRYWWIVGLLVALVLALASPLASPHPDGLERVAEDQGFIEHARGPVYELIPDYVFPGIGDEAAATVVAGIVGTLIVCALGFGLSRYLRVDTTSSATR